MFKHHNNTITPLPVKSREFRNSLESVARHLQGGSDDDIEPLIYLCLADVQRRAIRSRSSLRAFMISPSDRQAICSFRPSSHNANCRAAPADRQPTMPCPA
jgi:hypothetical protein